MFGKDSVMRSSYKIVLQFRNEWIVILIDYRILEYTNNSNAKYLNGRQSYKYLSVLSKVKCHDSYS